MAQSIACPLRPEAFASIGAIIGLLSKGFQAGGYTGGREGDLAGVVHGEEFVMNAAATRHWGLDALQMMSQLQIPMTMPPNIGRATTAAGAGYSPTGRSGGAASRRGGSQPIIQIHTHMDKDALNRHIANNPQCRHIIIDHVRGSAVDLGLPTA